jgi:tetratricopeptide (TPR) repeat protein
VTSVKSKVGWIVAAAVVLAAAGWLLHHWSEERAAQREVDEAVARVRSQIADPEHLSDGRVELDRILKRAPEHRDALRLRGEVLFALSLHEEAQADLTKALRESSGAERGEIQLLLGRVVHQRYRGSGSDDHFRLARNAYFEAQQVAETKAAALYALGVLYVEKGSNRNLDKAITLLDQMIEQFPDAADAEAARNLVAKLKAATAKEGG